MPSPWYGWKAVARYYRHKESVHAFDATDLTTWREIAVAHKLVNLYR